ncbi:hypothetical protein [Paracoccus luteus]|uniref:hypothetical protein n=1 Tax=Paracoccus luteus TaxID=2508543 RepID=UPI00107067C2|nr:hypothetical protein [Paracoccus luteus]
MKRALHLSLILLLVVTGLSLGAARGQARVAGQIVLCAGGAAVVQSVDSDGQPVGRTMVCPDMALSLLEAVASPAAQPVPPQGGHRVGALAPRVALDGRGPRPRQGRGPPAQV